MIRGIVTRLRELGPYRFVRFAAWRGSMIGLDRGPHVTRYTMYKRLAEIKPLLPSHTGRVLCISHSKPLLELLGITPTETVEADYPEYNILSMPFPEASFDFIVSDQVLEHVEGSPQQAIDECFRLLKSGGIACHTTCFINPIHAVPSDFWRFTADGLKVLHKDYGRIITAGAWGNFDVWGAVKDGMRFAPVPHASWHPLHKLAVKDDPEWPIVTWIVAQK